MLKKLFKILKSSLTTIVILLLLVVTSICDYTFKDIKDNSFYNFFSYSDYGQITEIVSGIIFCILATVGIAFSIQSNKLFGIRIIDLHDFRIRNHLSITKLFLLSIGIVVVNLIGLFFQARITCFTSILFLISISIFTISTEIRYLVLKESVWLKVLQEYLYFKYKKGELNKNNINLNKIFLSLLEEKSINELYKKLRIIPYIEFNKELLLFLINIQNDLTFQIEYYSSTNNHEKICTTLIQSINEEIYGTIKLDDILENEYEKQISEHQYKIFNYLLLSSYSKNKIERLISSYTHYLLSDKNFAKERFVNVVLRLITTNLHQNNFSLIRSIKRELSAFGGKFIDTTDRYKSKLFINISLFLFYMNKTENTVPQEIKNNILLFINQNQIKNAYVILSWKTLISNFIKYFSISIDEFIYTFNNNRKFMEYVLFNTVFTPKLTKKYATYFYMFLLLNKTNISLDFDYSKYLDSKDEKVIGALKEFFTEHFDESGNFTLTDNLRGYSELLLEDPSKAYSVFILVEKFSNNLFNFLNELVKDYFVKKQI